MYPCTYVPLYSCTRTRVVHGVYLCYVPVLWMCSCGPFPLYLCTHAPMYLYTYVPTLWLCSCTHVPLYPCTVPVYLCTLAMGVLMWPCHTPRAWAHCQGPAQYRGQAIQRKGWTHIISTRCNNHSYFLCWAKYQIACRLTFSFVWIWLSGWVEIVCSDLAVQLYMQQIVF